MFHDKTENMNYAVQRHKLVKRSKLPFNTLLRELKEAVQIYQSPNIMERLRDPAHVDQIIVSPKVQRKLRARNIDRIMLSVALSNGSVASRTSQKLSTSTPDGGRRLLKSHELTSDKKFLTYIYKENNFFNKTTVTKRCKLNVDDASTTTKCLCVRYIRESRKKPYIIIDAYIK